MSANHLIFLPYISRGHSPHPDPHTNVSSPPPCLESRPTQTTEQQHLTEVTLYDFREKVKKKKSDTASTGSLWDVLS